jgi:LacI family transcriptional regulator
MSLPNSVTLVDVARRADVSDATVSRVFSGRNQVREKTRRKVLEAAQELGYVINQRARSLASGHSNVVGLLLPNFTNLSIGYCSEIIQGVDDALGAHNYDLMLYNAHRGTDKTTSYLAAIERGLADGLVVVLPQDAGPYLDTLRRRRFPCVLIDHRGQNEDFEDCFAVDVTNWQGAFDATESLIKLGHTRIGFITGRMGLGCARDRLAGYQAALKKHKLKFDRQLVCEGTFQQPEGFTCAHTLLTLPDRPTAIFASNDMMAFGAMDAARDCGLRIPEDVSIVGFDDLPQSAQTHPPLTTVRQPLQEMGRAAVDMLLGLIKQPDKPPERTRLKTELVIRGSCQPPARRSRQVKRGATSGSAK